MRTTKRRLLKLEQSFAPPATIDELGVPWPAPATKSFA